jgi:hypothetical protein
MKVRKETQLGGGGRVYGLPIEMLTAGPSMTTNEALRKVHRLSAAKDAASFKRSAVGKAPMSSGRIRLLQDWLWGEFQGRKAKTERLAWSCET